MWIRTTIHEGFVWLLMKDSYDFSWTILFFPVIISLAQLLPKGKDGSRYGIPRALIILIVIITNHYVRLSVIIAGAL